MDVARRFWGWGMLCCLSGVCLNSAYAQQPATATSSELNTTTAQQPAAATGSELNAAPALQPPLASGSELNAVTTQQPAAATGSELNAPPALQPPLATGSESNPTTAQLPAAATCCQLKAPPEQQPATATSLDQDLPPSLVTPPDKSPATALLPEPDEQPAEHVSPASMFSKGQTSVQTLVGSYFSHQRMIGPQNVTYDFLPVDVRLGYMLHEGRFIGANLEGLIDLTESTVLKGPGTFFVGPSALLRLDFTKPQLPVVPYIQCGAGIILNDSYHDQEQRAIGQWQEFYLTAAFGLHFLINPDWSVDAEGGYGHISNADLAPRNLGVNGLGGAIGLTYTFGKHCRD